MKQVTEDDLVKAARAAYEAWIEPVKCCEPSWPELPNSFKMRFVQAMRAAFEAIE